MWGDDNTLYLDLTSACIYFKNEGVHIRLGQFTVSKFNLKVTSTGGPGTHTREDSDTKHRENTPLKFAHRNIIILLVSQ